MILHRFLLLGAALAAVTACGSDSTSPKVITPGPAGFIRIVNAVPDTGAQDFRFMDVVEGVPNVEFANLAFRQGTDRGYQRVSVGTHHIRVFMSGSNLNAAGLANDPAIVSTVLGDTTFTFAEGVARFRESRRPEVRDYHGQLLRAGRQSVYDQCDEFVVERRRFLHCPWDYKARSRVGSGWYTHVCGGRTEHRDGLDRSSGG